MPLTLMLDKEMSDVLGKVRIYLGCSVTDEQVRKWMVEVKLKRP